MISALTPAPPLPEHHGCWPTGKDDLLSYGKIVQAMVMAGENREDTLTETNLYFGLTVTETR